MRRASVLPFCLLALSCASYTAMAPKEREQVEQTLTARESEQFLKLSYYVTPFFGDASNASPAWTTA